MGDRNSWGEEIRPHLRLVPKPEQDEEQYLVEVGLKITDFLFGVFCGLILIVFLGALVL